MNICENCGLEHEGSYGSGRFCNKKCACCFSTKKNREEINRKVSNKLTKVLEIRLCENCGCELTTRRKKIKTCSASCSTKLNWKNPEFKNKVINSIRERASTIEEKLRLKEIGRMGGFGKKGYTDTGVYYESLLEKKCFEFLDEIKILYEPHKSIPNSSKVSDLFLIDYNIWIEIDGIDREKRKKWLGENYTYWLEKIEIYKKENLVLIIIKTYDEFVEIINKLKE